MQKFNFRPALSCALALGTVALFGACDDITGDDDRRLYTATLAPLNNSGVQGTATFRVDEDGLFVAGVGATGLAPGQTHPQHIHAAGQCPTPAMAGEDGLLTVPDGAPAYGLILLPLDSDLTMQSVQDFPQGNVITYQETADYDEIVASLSGPDNDPDDMVTKLDGNDLLLQTRSVVLHGAFVLNDRVVPAGTAGAEYMATLPVACGTVLLVDE